MVLPERLDPVKEFPSLFINKMSQIDYSDGEIENFILKSLDESQGSKTPYEDWEKLIKDWPTEYHFSWVRTNIFAPVEMDKDWKVLELGGGTGILTHYIASRVKNIVSVEGSLLRAKCISKRCSAFDNVTVIASNFEDLNLIDLYGEHSFDVITLIGVLEYTNKYFKSPTGIKDLLDDCHRLLKTDGSLIIAIENRLGLKYLLGWDEDHVGVPFYGIEDRYGDKDVITYGYYELQEVLNKSSFNCQKFFCPLPDYKMPGIILAPTKRILEDNERLLYSNLTYKTDFRNYSGDISPRSKASRVLKGVINNHLLFDTANSFLVIASPGSKVKKNLFEDNCIAHYFSSKRKFTFASHIKFFKTEPHSISFEKSRLLKEKESKFPSDSVLQLQIYPVERRLVEDGILLDAAIEDAFYKNQHSKFENYINQWIGFLKKKLRDNEFFEFDFMPFNIIINSNGELVAIDELEWKCLYSLSAEQLLARFFILNNHYIDFCTAEGSKDFEKINYILKKFKLGAITVNDLEIIQLINDFTVSTIGASQAILDYSWEDRQESLVNKLIALVPSDEIFIIVDEGKLNLHEIFGDRSIPFPEKNGIYWGLLENDDLAINELERLRAVGAKTIIFPWSSFWWLDYYKILNSYLRNKYTCELENEDLIVFDLKEQIK